MKALFSGTGDKETNLGLLVCSTVIETVVATDFFHFVTCIKMWILQMSNLWYFACSDGRASVHRICQADAGPVLGGLLHLLHPSSTSFHKHQCHSGSLSHGHIEMIAPSKAS